MEYVLKKTKRTVVFIKTQLNILEKFNKSLKTTVNFKLKWMLESHHFAPIIKITDSCRLINRC